MAFDPAAFLRFAVILCLLGTVRCFAQDAMPGMTLLGVNPANQPPAKQAAPAARTPWQRLAPDVQIDLSRVLRRQLDQPARKELGLPAGTLVAACDDGATPYADWQALGRREPSWANPDTWPAYYFERGLDENGRRILLALYAKLKAERIWDRIETFDRFSSHPTWPGFWIIPLDREDFQSYLAGLGYGRDQIDTRGDRWAVRAPSPGAQLHVIGPHGDGDPRFVEVHVDFASPGTMTVKPTLGSVLSAPVREICYGARALDHWRRDVKLEGTDEFGGRVDRMADRLQSAFREQGLDVPDVDEVACGALMLSNTLKWKTQPSWFGYLWLRPEDGRAGWWTEADGAHDFTKVERLDPAGAPRFVLTYENGWVEARIGKDGRLSGRWFRGSGREADGTPSHREFQGELVLGHARTVTP